MVDFYFLGQVDIEESLILQEKTLDLCSKQRVPPSVLMLEHPEVITSGKSSCKESIDFLSEKGIQVFQVDRGGELTAHMPGQLVIYPVLPIKSMALTVKKYVYLMEQLVINMLRDYGVIGQRRKSHPGVWVAEQKIASLGIRIKQRTTMHGLAINISNDVGLFSQFNPCGIEDCQVASLEMIIGRVVSLEEISHKLVDHFARIFQTKVSKIRGREDWQQTILSNTKI